MEIEIRSGEFDAEGQFKPLPRSQSNVFSIYVGKPGSFACLLDCTTYNDALRLAVQYAEDWGIECVDRTLEETRKWYWFHDGVLDYIGEFETFEDASGHADAQTIWIFSEEELDELYERIKELRGEKR